MGRLLDRALSRLLGFMQEAAARHRQRQGLPAHPHITIGRHSYGVGRDTVFKPGPDAPVSIGGFCSIGPGVVLMARGDRRTDLPSLYPFRTKLWNEKGGPNCDATTKGPIAIGHDVWIGANAVVLSGVTIGTGAIVGAGAVVARDVPPYAIAVGNPARIVRHRFSPERIAALLASAWWDLPDDVLRALDRELYSGDIEAFIDAVQDLRNGEAPK